MKMLGRFGMVFGVLSIGMTVASVTAAQTIKPAEDPRVTCTQQTGTETEGYRVEVFASSVKIFNGGTQVAEAASTDSSTSGTTTTTNYSGAASDDSGSTYTVVFTERSHNDHFHRTATVSLDGTVVAPRYSCDD
jgi:hypothetical protein